MKKVKIETNGFVLWYRARYNGKVAYAKQYESTAGLGDDKNPTHNPVYIAFDGAEPEDLIDVLEERENLRAKVKKLELTMSTENEYTHDDIYKRLDRIESRKKWYQFWRSK